MTVLRYGLEWDRDYLMDFAFRMYSIGPIISSLTIYPMNLYLLTVGIQGMKFEIRAAYLANVIAHVMYDWTFSVFVGAYQFPPYGLFYCEGLMAKIGFSKQVILGVLAWTTTLTITVFFILMVQLHQLTVFDAKSRWKLSVPVQLVIYTLLTSFCLLNVAGFIVFGADVDNYEEVVKGADLSWLVERGGTLLLFGVPGILSRFRLALLFVLVSIVIFLPFFTLYIAHALIYLRKRNRHVVSTKTQLLTQRLFDTFSTQLVGATIFFTLPLTFVLISSVHDLSGIIPGPLFAVLRFVTTMLLVFDAAQFSLVFILRSAMHRKIVMRRLRKIPAFSLLFPNPTNDNQKSVITLNSLHKC